MNDENLTQSESPAGTPTAPSPLSESPVTNQPIARPGRDWADFALVGLLFVLALAAYFRFTGLNWDAGTHLHPDERFLTQVAASLEPAPDLFTYLRTSQSGLNPYNKNFGFFVYGNFPMTVTRYVAEWVTKACANFDDVCSYTYTAYDGVHLLGRFLSGLVDLVSVLFIFLIGRQLYDWRVGLLAALLTALAVMQIQQSHFFTMDNWAAAFCTIALYFAVRAAEESGRKRWWLLFGLALGLAVASRINVAPLAGMAALAALIWLVRRAGEQGWVAYLLTSQGAIDMQQAATGVLLAAVVSFLTFRLAMPYAFADSTIIRETALNETGEEPSAVRLVIGSLVGLNPQWRNNMAEIQGQQSPEASFPPALQWTDRAAILFPLTNMILYGMGLTAGLAAWVGLVWALWRIIRSRPDWTYHLLPVAWGGLYFLFMGTRWVKSIRYFLPIYPILLLLAAWALLELCKLAGKNRLKQAFSALTLIVVVLYTFAWANTFLQTTYQQPLTRVAASEWMYDNLPSGATLLYEANGQPLEYQLPLKGYEFTAGGFPINLNFTLPVDGVVTGVRFNYLYDPDNGDDEERLEVSLIAVDGSQLAIRDQNLNLGPDKEAVTVELERVAVPAGTLHTIRAQSPAGGPIAADTSRIVNEHWDDLLPVSIADKLGYANYYSEVTGGQRPVTHPDNDPEKLSQMLQWLDEADYIALSSQRSLWNTPRLPLTYPLNIAYYQGLFSGELGFELVSQFHANYHIGPLYISDTGGKISWGRPPEIGWPPPGDLAAEEAFSVYDHPPVWIFRKTADYDPLVARQFLNGVDLSQVVVMNPGQATKAPNAMQLSPEAQSQQQSNGTFNDLFPADSLLNRNRPAAVIVWWLAVILLGWLAFPISFVVFRGLPGRGYALSRILVLLLISYFGWLLASLNILPNSRSTLLLGLGLVGLVSGGLAFWHRPGLTTWIQQNRRYILTVELVSLALFLIGLLIRLGNPDVWDVIWGGEKPMDLSYFNAVLKSSTFPPYDPWYAGGYINYYYYGFVYVGALTKLLGVMPTTAYNLIIPMLFSFTGLGAFAIAYNLVASRGWGQKGRAVPAGIAAAILCVLLGNLAEFGVLSDAWQRTSDSTIQSGLPAVDTLVRTLDGLLDVTIGGKQPPIYPGDWFWTASRAINFNDGEAGPITEFPFFTFLYADLHAHMISMPLTLLALAWAVSLVLAAENEPKQTSRVSTALIWLIGGLTIGVLRATNTWDWPTYLFLGCLATIYAASYTFENGDSGRRRFDLQWLGSAGLQVVLLAALSVILFWPYVENYGVGYEKLRRWDGSFTYLLNYLSIYGLFLFLAITHILGELRAWGKSWQQEQMQKMEPIARLLLLALVVFLLLILAFMVKGYWIAPLVLTLIVLSGLLGLRPGLPIARRIVLILISSALGLTLLVEIVVLDGDVGRMNTVFKFYMQVWLLLSIAGGVALAQVWPAVKEQRGLVGRGWRLGLGILLIMAALYPVLATKAKWDIRMSQDAPKTIDGMAFMEYTAYGDTAQDGSSKTVQLSYEYEALRWIQQNISGSPVIVEAHSGNPYRSIAARVAMYTGLPTVIGWDWHQRQQRAAVPDNLVWNRVNDVQTLFNTLDMNETMAIINKYNISYIYAGQLEWIYYNPQGLLKFDQMVAAGYLQEVFRNNAVSIYQVLNN